MRLSASLNVGLAGGNQHQHTTRTAEVNAFQQRAGHGGVGGLGGAVRAAGGCRAHHRLARLAHHGLHVFEVYVHLAGDVDDVADTAHGVLQHVIGMAEGLLLRDVVAHHFEQLLVQHHASGGSKELSGGRRPSVRTTLVDHLQALAGGTRIPA